MNGQERPGATTADKPLSANEGGAITKESSAMQTPGAQPKKSILSQVQEKLAAENITIGAPGDDVEGRPDAPFEAAKPPKPPAPRDESGRFASADGEKPAEGTPAGTGADATGQVKPAADTTTRDTAGAADTAPKVIDAKGGAASKPADAGGTPPKGESKPADAAPKPGEAAPEFVAVEVDDDLGVKYTIQAPKDAAQKLKEGFLRRSDYTRKTQALAKYRPVLEARINDGTMEVVAPLLSEERAKYIVPILALAQQNYEYSKAMVDLYNKAINGQPLTYGNAPAAASAAPAGAAAPTNVDIDAAIAKVVEADPFLGEQLKAVLPAIINPVLAQNATLAKQVEQLGGFQKTFEERQAAEAQRTQAIQAQQRLRDDTYSAFKTRWPQSFGHDESRDMAHLSELYEYANSMGYIASEGYIPGLIHAEYDAIAAHASSTPDSAAATEAAAQRQRNEAAAAVAGQTQTHGSAPAAQQNQPPPQIRLRDKAGHKRPMRELLREAVEITEAQTRAQ